MSAITCAKSLALSALSSGGEGRVLPWLRLGRRDGRQIPRHARLAPNWRRQKPRDGFEHEVWLIATKKPSRGRPASRGVGLAKHSNLAFPPPDARRRQAAVAKRHRSRPQALPPASQRCYRRRSCALARHARRHRGEPGATSALFAIPLGTGARSTAPAGDPEKLHLPPHLKGDVALLQRVDPVDDPAQRLHLLRRRAPGVVPDAASDLEAIA